MYTRYTILLLVCICTVGWSYAQQKANITAAQYFFDKDPGVGASKPLIVTTSDTTVNIADSISTASLKPGFHTLSIRVKNSAGKWNLIETRSFYIADSALRKLNIAKITAAQYFFDKDPGIGASKALKVTTSDTSVNFGDSISTASLKAGFHTLSIRVMTGTGKWSIYETRSFYIADSALRKPNIAKITAAQYFFDKDPGIGASKALKVTTSDTSVNFGDSISTASLKAGFHTLSIRVMTGTGKWSIYETRSFYIADSTVKNPNIARITAAQYFFDKDPGIVGSKPLNVTTSDTTIKFGDSISTASLKPGFHTLSIRVKNGFGKWSIYETKSFYITDTALRQPIIAKITAAEYFFDKDPGAGRGKPLKVPTSDTVVNFNDSIPTGILAGRDHTLTIRVKNRAGRWSFFESQSFSFAPSNADRDGLLDYEEPAYGTDPTNFDTNGDNLADGVNVFTGLAALSTDTDGDGISNLQEIINGTNPILKDSDGDGVPDNKDPFPLDRFRSVSPSKNAADHTPPVITLSEPF
jgi:hypothetical protein